MATALLIVDYQNDFVAPRGALAVPGAERIAGRIAQLAADDAYDVVIATRDWHPADHGSFREQGGPWPPHCVQGTPGAELHQAIPHEQIDAVVEKGHDVATEGYSGFEDTELALLLREDEVTAVTIVGVATDYCVANTARDALREGLIVTIDASAVRGIDAEPGDSERALEELSGLGAVIIDAPDEAST